MSMRFPRGVTAIDKLFLTIMNMSLTGAFIVVVICLARLPLKKAPKIISYCLWAVVGFRLVFPISIGSVFSLIPFKAQTIPPDIATQPVPHIDSGISFINNAVSRMLPSSPGYMSPGANPLRTWMAIGSWVWLLGAVVMLIFGVVFYIRLRRRTDSAIRVEDYLYETDGIQSPFVLGVINPKIYLPLDISGQEREYILRHERTHIWRYDHIIKFVAYFILSLHWFNPLVWAAFLLMGVDMEMSCDERVLKNLGGEIKKDYSMSLLSLATDRRVVLSSPLAFGEYGVKKRIKNVLKFRKSSRFSVVLAIVFVAVLSLGFLMSRASSGDMFSTQETGVDTAGTETVSIGADTEYDLDNIPSETETMDTDDGTEIDPGHISSGNAADGEKVYIITDYYNTEDGMLSALGLSLDEMNSERVLVVSGGDIIIAGGRRYEVTVESLTLSFYTQPMLDQVIRWWADYLDSWEESGKVTVLN